MGPFHLSSIFSFENIKTFVFFYVHCCIFFFFKLFTLCSSLQADGNLLMSVFYCNNVINVRDSYTLFDYLTAMLSSSSTKSPPAYDLSPAAFIFTLQTKRTMAVRSGASTSEGLECITHVGKERNMWECTGLRDVLRNITLLLLWLVALF